MKTQKEKLRVILFTQHHRIKGEVHLYENSRLTDILNADAATKDFLPVTDAEVLDLRSNKAQEVSFLSINRHNIEMVMEDDEVVGLVKAKELISKRRFPEALACITRAAKAAPESPEVQYVYGFCLAKSGEIKAARVALEKCLSLKPMAEIRQKTEEFLKSLP